MLKFKYVSQGSLKTVPSSADPIASRSLRLNQVFQVKYYDIGDPMPLAEQM